MTEEQHGLPPGWAEASLGDITLKKVIQGAPQGNSFHYIDIGSVDRQAKSIGTVDPQPAASAPSRARQSVSAGDVLVSMTRPNLNAVAVVPTELDGATASTGFDVLRSVEIESEWVFAHVRSRVFVDEMTRLVQGALYPAVKSADVRASRLPIPPLNEQKRIVAKIEALQARSDAAKEALDAIPPLLEQFRQSVLAAAFRGDLTKAWRAENPDVEPASELLARIRVERRTRWIENAAVKARDRARARAAKGGKPWSDEHDAKVLERERAKAAKKYKAPEPVDAEGLPELPEGWCWASLDELLVSLRSGTTTRAVKTPTEHRVLRSSAVRHGRIDYDDFSYLASAEGESLDNVVREGDIYFTRLSGSLEYVANCAAARNLRERVLWYPDRLIRGVLVGCIAAAFVELAFEAKGLRRELEAAAKSSAGHQRVSLSDLRQFLVPLPSRKEQQQIIQFCNEAFVAASATKTTAITAAGRLDTLNQSILAKAFRGELVPQDPNDEPASVLIERIRAEREAAEAAKPKKKRGRGRRKKAAPTPAKPAQPSLPCMEDGA